MTTKELKEKYLKFFESRGHVIIPSVSLIPENDPTVLFTTAGMHPLVPYLLGEKHPSGNRLANVQKCLRTDDIEEVGDNTHITFFEMLGNWSLGDYWKKESISWSFEFLTKELSIPLEKLAVTCFAGDDDAPRDEESAEIWKSLGVSENRVFFLGKKDNWWGPAGKTGPCGPDTEIFYWTGEGEPADLTSAENSDGWVEIWNNVFMQYEKKSDASYVPLKQKNVDTGMGVERTTAIINGKDNIYETDAFENLIETIKGLAVKQDEKKDEKSIRIIADHIRASTFILGDQRCVAPSNVDQGYVLRRLIRRAVRYGRNIGIEKSFLVDLSKVVVDQYSGDYPELLQNRDFIEKYLGLEEERFRKTLEKARPWILKNICSKIKVIRDGGEVHIDFEDDLGKNISYAYQSLGYPPELSINDVEEYIRDLLFGSNINTVSSEVRAKIRGVEKDVVQEMTKHRNTSRTGAEKRFKGGLSDDSEMVVRYHTATHLLNLALRKVLGDHVEQIGSNITGERLRFDFPHSGRLTDEEVSRVEDIINKTIDEKLPVSFQILPREDAVKIGALHLRGENYPDQVKVYFIGDSLESAVSKEFCGGPHVKNTGDIGFIEIYKQDKIGEGKMRVYARFKKI